MSQQTGKISISFKEACGILTPYVKDRVVAQIKNVWIIVAYLVIFQTLILGIRITDASLIAFGIAAVIVGLAFFMEGLMIGLMPLGEIVGVKLPQKSSVPVMLAFSLVIGFLATLAEPAISALQTAGSFVKPWEAPLLFVMLNRHADSLVYAVGTGVGIAVVMGMLRFIFKWSLKPYLYIIVPTLGVMTFVAYLDPNMNAVTGLAWDCGAITTGPVTVPLVLALGIGVSRMLGAGGTSDASGGFGVVTLASLFPIMMVLGLGFFLSASAPKPSSEKDFFSTENRQKSAFVFGSETELKSWVEKNGSAEAVAAVLGSVARTGGAVQTAASQGMDYMKILVENSVAAVKAIGILVIPMLIALFFLLREKLPKPDEMVLGIVLAIVGMGIFNLGIFFGLQMLGNQIGSRLPAAFKSLEMSDSAIHIKGFNTGNLETSLTEAGEKKQFFFLDDGGQVKPVFYEEKNHDKKRDEYRLVPRIGPLYGGEWSFWGILVVLFFGFVMGYGATLAEPALNALGMTVEELTVGTFKKSLLMHTVAFGVGLGILLGVIKIIYDLPLFWMCVPPYMLLLFVTWLSDDSFVNIGWDSAGVTTGPVTVPLVLAMGLGISGQVGVAEGFGILAMASVCPVFTVLLMGLFVTRAERSRRQLAGVKESVAAV